MPGAGLHDSLRAPGEPLQPEGQCLFAEAADLRIMTTVENSVVPVLRRIVECEAPL